MQYEHTQPGTLIRVMMGCFIVFIGGVLLTALTKNEGASVWVFAPILIMVVILALFHSLTVTIDGNQIELAFGIGIIRKSFFVEDIETASATRSHWYNGWGIRLIRHGWLYNVSGFDVVQLNMRNGKVYQIGTDEPQALLKAVESAMGPRGGTRHS